MIWRAPIGVLVLLLGQSAYCSIRGLDPELASRYKEAGPFTCIDGSAALKPGRINDGYCDCLDGSDEPGTSACINGRFYCRNRGHHPVLLNASFVDDGVCDCCDGSDERSGCQNTCRELGAAARQQLKHRATEYAAGLRTRSKYAQQHAAKLKSWQAEAEAAAKEHDAQKLLMEKLTAEKDAAEAAEAEHKKQQEAAGTGASTSLTPASDDAAQVLPEQSSGQEPAGADAQATAAEGEQQPVHQDNELSPDEVGRRIASQWTSDPAAAGGASGVSDPQKEGQEAAAAAAAASEAGMQGQDQDHMAAARAALDTARTTTQGVLEMAKASRVAAPVVAPAARLLDWSRSAAGWLRSKLGLKTTVQEAAQPAGTPAAPTHPAIEHANEVRSRYWQENTKLSDLERKITDLRTRLGDDFGADGAFSALLGKCFEAHVDKYVYELCPYGNAAQKEGASSTSLGSWGGFGDGHRSMRFTNGAQCWQGPPRSLTVAVACGSSERVSKVEEPSRCEYTADFETPAACSAAEVQHIQQQVQQQEQELQSDHSEL